MAADTTDDLTALVARAKAGDRHALETVLAKVAPSVYRFGLRMCRNVPDAEDVLQDALLGVASHLGQFEARSSMSSWVFAITRSACARRRRGLKNQPAAASDALLAETADHAPSPEAQAADRELAEALRVALDRLSTDHREVIMLRDVEGLSAPEAAGVLGISVDALKSRLHRARESLREALRPMLEPATEGHPAGCPDVALLWSKKLEGDLSQVDCSAMEAHLASCPACGAACDALKTALLACQRIRAEELPPAVQQRVRSAVRAWAQKMLPQTEPTAVGGSSLG